MYLIPNKTIKDLIEKRYDFVPNRVTISDYLDTNSVPFKWLDDKLITTYIEARDFDSVEHYFDKSAYLGRDSCTDCRAHALAKRIATIINNIMNLNFENVLPILRWNDNREKWDIEPHNDSACVRAWIYLKCKYIYFCDNEVDFDEAFESLDLENIAKYYYHFEGDCNEISDESIVKLINCDAWDILKYSFKYDGTFSINNVIKLLGKPSSELINKLYQLNLSTGREDFDPIKTETI